MSLMLFDEDGYIDDVATNLGWWNVIKYVERRTKLKKRSSARAFVNKGYSYFPQRVARELETFKPPQRNEPLKIILKYLIPNLKKCKGIGIVSASEQ